MVLIAAYRCLSPLLQDWIEGRIAQVLVAIAKGHLVYDIESQRVGQFIETRLTGIVGGADIVYRGFLHQAHITQYGSLVYHLYCLWVCRMTVHSTQFYRAPIKLQYVSFYCQFPEAELMLKGLQNLVLLQ